MKGHHFEMLEQLNFFLFAALGPAHCYRECQKSLAASSMWKLEIIQTT